MSKDAEKFLTVAGTVAAIALLAGFVWAQAHFEAAAFNNATGKNVSTWDAIWIDLRVQGEGK